MSVKLSLEKYSRRNSGIKKHRQKRPRNESPEKAVEKEVIEWLSKNGFEASVVESKAVYSKSAGRYLRGQTESGFSDIVGTDRNGFAIFIELKAVGKRKTISHTQTDFLKARISRGAFCVCTDSVCHLSHIYNTWIDLKRSAEESARQLLLNDLPKTKHGEEIKVDHELPW